MYFFGDKKRTVSEVFYRFGSILPFWKYFTVLEVFYHLGSILPFRKYFVPFRKFFSALWDRLNQFVKLDQAIT